MYNILLVDDSKTIQKVVELTVKDIEGIDIFLSSDSVHAFELLEDNDIDLLFLDVNLPDNTGYDMLKEIRKKEKYADAPIYLIWGTFEDFDPSLANSIGASGFFRKPFESEFFLNIINFAKNGNPILSSKEINNSTVDEWNNALNENQEEIREAEETLFDEPVSQYDNFQEPEREDEFLFEEEEIKPDELDFVEEEDFLFNDPDQETEAEIEEDEIAVISDVDKSEEPFFTDSDIPAEEEDIADEAPEEDEHPEDDIEIKKDETVELDEEELVKIKKGTLVHEQPDYDEAAEDLGEEDAGEEEILMAEYEAGDVIGNAEEDSVLEEEEEILEIASMDNSIESSGSDRDMIAQDVEPREEPTLESYMETDSELEESSKDYTIESSPPSSETADSQGQGEPFEEAEESLEDTIEFLPGSKFYPQKEALSQDHASLIDRKDFTREMAELKHELTTKINGLVTFFQTSVSDIIQDSINKVLEKRTEEVLWETIPSILDNLLKKQLEDVKVHEIFLKNFDEHLKKALLEQTASMIVEKIDIEVIEEKASKILENICWEVVPELSEIIIKSEIEKLKRED